MKLRGAQSGMLAAVLAMAGCGEGLEGRGAEGETGQGRGAFALPSASGSFHDPLDTFDPGRWYRSDGWVSANEFNAGWRADHVDFSGGTMQLRLDKTPCPGGCSGRPYASGEYASTAVYGFGLFEVRMKPARGSGTVTGFFLYTGAYEGTLWNEIDLEFLGRDTRHLQTNYFTDGVGRHETLIELPFDAADDFHTYGIEWAREAIHWYVDGQRVHTETGSRGPLPIQPVRIMMNFWPATGIDVWSGPFVYPGSPMVAAFDDVRYTPAAELAQLRGATP